MFKGKKKGTGGGRGLRGSQPKLRDEGVGILSRGGRAGRERAGLATVRGCSHGETQNSRRFEHQPGREKMHKAPR